MPTRILCDQHWPMSSDPRPANTQLPNIHLSNPVPIMSDRILDPQWPVHCNQTSEQLHPILHSSWSPTVRPMRHWLLPIQLGVHSKSPLYFDTNSPVPSLSSYSGPVPDLQSWIRPINHRRSLSTSHRRLSHPWPLCTSDRYPNLHSVQPVVLSLGQHMPTGSHPELSRLSIPGSMHLMCHWLLPNECQSLHQKS